MKKVVLVIEGCMPGSCWCCPLLHNGYDGELCEAEKKDITSEDKFTKRPDWCPLKEMELDKVT